MSLNYENFQVQTKPDDFTLSGYLLNTIGNRDFYNRIFQALTKTTKSNFWKNLDHVLNIEDCKQPIFDIIYNNIKYYLDNVSNVDLCKVKALQSIISYYGVSYDVFNYLKDMPIELYNMLNLFSINRYYLFDYDRGVLGKDLKEKIYQEVKPDEVSGNTYTDIPIRNMSEITVGPDYAGHVQYNYYTLAGLWKEVEVTSVLTNYTITSSALSVGPDGRVVTGPDGKPEYVKFEVTLPTYTSSFLSLQLSNDNFENNPRINQELLQYLLNHPGKHVYDWDLIPDEVVVSGYTNASIKKYYERALRDAKDEEHRSIYRSILSNQYTNELSSRFGDYTLVSSFDQSGYDVNLREVYRNFQTDSYIFKLYLDPKSEFILKYYGFTTEKSRYAYLFRNGSDGHAVLEMLSDVMAHGIYDQTQTYTAYATVSSGEELADVISEVGPENIISAEEIQPAVSAYTYELRSIADLDDGWQNLKDLSSTLSVVTYEAKYERLSNGTVIDEETPLRAEMTDAVGPFVSLISSLDDASTGTTGGLSSFRYECSAGVHIKPAFKSISEVNLSSVEYLRSNISVDPPDPGFIDVRIEQPGVSSVAYLSGQTYHYFFADFHYDKLHTDADDKYTLLSTYLVSVDFDYLLSSPEHGYDLVSEASFEQGIPGSLMLIAQNEISADVCGVDFQYKTQDASYYEYTRIDESKYRKMLASAYEEMIRDAVKEKYVGGDYIYKTIYDAEDLDNQIVKLKNEYAVPLSFNESAAADAVENGLSSLSDFDAKQAKVVSFELDRRKQPSDPARYDSRYAYYRKQKVLQYVQYVESLYNIFYNKNYKTYDVDKTYFNLDDSNYVNLVQKIDGEVKLDETMFADVAQVLADMTLNVVSIRDKIKTMVERNSIRGTWLIVALYVIEYFRNVVKNNYKGAGDGLTIKDFSLVEYYDNTEYFNVENERINYTAEQRQQLNSRFWEETRTGTLETSEISVFYRDLIEHASKAHVSVDLLPVLPDFMKTLYRAGSNQRYDFASNSFYGLSSIVQARLDQLSAGMTEEQVAQISDQIAEISANPEQYGLSSMVLSSQRPDVNWQETAVVYKQLMTDSSDMQKALYNVKNTVHPSYQIHPYIYDFSQTTDIKSPIGSKFHCSIPKRYDEQVSAKIDEYIDAIGAICDIWKYDMFDFTGYASGYELASNKGDFPEISPYCDRDGMFVEEALSAYLADYNGFIDQLVVGEDGRIINPFYRHLNLGSDELQAEADRLKTWYACIHALVTDPGFDIYSYAKDINGDHYAVYKKYPYDDYTQDEKRDTLGFMWTRAKNHPIAFPTFDLYLDPDGKFTYFLNGSRETTKSSFLGRAYTKSKVHGIVTDASQFPVGFYDFDFDNSLQNLLLFAPSRQYTTQFGYKNCDVIVGCVRKYFDSDINSYYSEYDKLGNFVYYLRNRNIRKSAEQKTWRDLIGVYKNLSKVSFLYASKYLDEDGSESFYSATTLDQRNVSYALELQVEQIDFADTTKTQYDIRVDGLEYNLRRGDIAMEYSDNVMTLAYIGKNTMDNNFVVNYVEHSNNEMDYDQISQAVEFEKRLSSSTMEVGFYDGNYAMYDTSLLDYSMYQYELSNRQNFISDENRTELEYILIRRPNDDLHYSEIEVVMSALTYTQYLPKDLYGVAQYPLYVTSNSSEAKDNRFDAFNDYVVAINFQFQNGQIRQYGDVQHYNLNCDPAFIPSYPNSQGKMRVWLNDTLSSLGAERHHHRVQMMGKASPYYRDIMFATDVDQFIENKQAGISHGIRWEQYPLISAVNARQTQNELFSLDGIVNANDVGEIKCVALTKPVVSATTYYQMSAYIDDVASRLISYDREANTLSINSEVPGTKTTFYDRTINIEPGVMSSLYDSSLDRLSVWHMFGNRQLSVFNLPELQVSSYAIRDIKSKYLFEETTQAYYLDRDGNMQYLVRSEYSESAGHLSTWYNQPNGNISVFMFGNGQHTLSGYDSETNTWSRRDDISAVYGALLSFDDEARAEADLDWAYIDPEVRKGRYNDDITNLYAEREAWYQSHRNSVSAYQVDVPDYSKTMQVADGISVVANGDIASAAQLSIYSYVVPRRQFIIAFYKAYQEYTDVQGTTTHLPLSTVLNPSGDNLNSSLDGQNPDRITIPEDYLILTGHPTEQIKGDSVLSTAAWIVNIYRKNRDDDGRIIVYSVVANQDDVYTDYYGHRLYQDNVDTSPVKIANQSGAKTFDSIYVPPVERLSVSTSVKARAISEDTAEIDVRLSLVLSAQYPGYWFEPWTFQYDVIPVDYVNYAEFEQYHILQLRERDSQNDPLKSVSNIKFDAEHGPEQYKEYFESVEEGQDPALAFKYQNEIDTSEISGGFPPLLNQYDRVAQEEIYTAYNQDTVTDIRTNDQFVAELDDIPSKRLSVQYDKLLSVHEDYVETENGVLSVLEADLERLSGYYAFDGNDFSDGGIYLYFNYNNHTVNSFIAPFYKYSYAIIPPNGVKYLGLFNQVNACSAYGMDDTKRISCLVRYHLAYLAGYRISNISDDKPKYAAESLALSDFLIGSGLSDDISAALSAGKLLNGTFDKNDILWDAKLGDMTIPNQTRIWPKNIGDELTAIETQRRGFLFQNPNKISAVQASASHSKYTEDDVRNKTFDYFAAGYGLNLNDRIGIQNIVSADLVKINYSEAESNVDDIEKFYVEAYASFYTGPTERYLQGFMDEQTKVYAEVPVVIKPNLQYKPYYSGLTATALALCEDGDDIALEDDEGCVLTDEDTVYDSNPSVLIAHKTSVTPFIDRVYSFMPKGLDVVPDEEYTHMLDIRDAYDLKNNYGVDVLSILFNFELSDISISDAEDQPLPDCRVRSLGIDIPGGSMSLSNIMNVWLSSADTANCTLTAALAGSRLETVMNFNIGDDWESFQYRQHGHAGAFNLWSDAPEFAYLSDSRIYSCRSEIADIKSYTFTTNGIVPVTGLRSTASKDDVLELTSDFYTEDFIIWPEGQTDVLEYQLVKEPPYGFRITNSFIAGKVSAIIESEPYGYLESLNNNGIVQLDMTNRKNRRINLTAYHEGESYVVNQQTVLSVELFDIFELESNSQFKTDFAYFGGNGVQLVLVGDSRPLSAIGYENNYRRSAVQAVSPTLEYEGGLAPVDVSQLRVRAIAKNTNLQISGDVGVHVDTTVRSVKAYHYTNGSYKLMQEGYSMKLSAMDQLDTIRFNIPVEIVSRDAYESHTGGTGGTDYAGDYMDCILEEADDKLMLVALHKVYSNSNGDNPSPISVYVSSPAYHLTGCVQFYIDAAENALSTINIIDNRPMTIENNMSVLLDVDRPFASITEYDEAELTATALTSDM